MRPKFSNICFEAMRVFLIVVHHPSAAASLMTPCRWSKVSLSKDADGKYASYRVSEGHPYEDSHGAEIRSLPTGWMWQS